MTRDGGSHSRVRGCCTGYIYICACAADVEFNYVRVVLQLHLDRS